MPAPKDNYAEHTPCAALRLYVECFWSRAGRAGASTAAGHRVLPDGCLDIVFNFGDSAPWSAAVVGTMTRPLVVEPGRREDFLGVRFRPGKARAFLRPPADEFTDRAVRLADAWGRDGAELEERLAGMPALRARLGALENALLRRLAQAPAADTRLDAAVEVIARSRGAVSVERLSGTVGWSRQHLARRFTSAVGVGPKLFCRVVRFRGLVESARALKLGWAEAAAEYGYYDQAHLIAEFKEFAGLTPAQFFAAR
ncbi:MAG: DUF6597 domain-containing transcriptional factor [Candidatus Acidiferrales bacterium]